MTVMGTERYCMVGEVAKVTYGLIAMEGKDDDDDDVTILMCTQKLTGASLIYRTEPETKSEKKRTKNKNGYRVCS